MYINQQNVQAGYESADNLFNETIPNTINSAISNVSALYNGAISKASILYNETVIPSEEFTFGFVQFCASAIINSFIKTNIKSLIDTITPPANTAAYVIDSNAYTQASYDVLKSAYDAVNLKVVVEALTPPDTAKVTSYISEVAESIVATSVALPAQVAQIYAETDEFLENLTYNDIEKSVSENLESFAQQAKIFLAPVTPYAEKFATIENDPYACFESLSVKAKAFYTATEKSVSENLESFAQQAKIFLTPVTPYAEKFATIENDTYSCFESLSLKAKVLYAATEKSASEKLESFVRQAKVFNAETEKSVSENLESFAQQAKVFLAPVAPYVEKFASIENDVCSYFESLGVKAIAVYNDPMGSLELVAQSIVAENSIIANGFGNDAFTV